ncbi:hypothetical protein BGW36DRAFT_289844 [Talaromyces proteolyticus]|uniref:Uncharacterized protein n=1 Tax=Talaromyces proteolyticus TaxID=1131652 RepID=A0AAD4KZ03_9EURO|nr:uncharacterized protein BGW36DRAFT_289844 [Talaromyces proteolyticus]KAH8702378.1 hypothetical protein BGW36DRAFT_289844 [Talaromyces proteolyticus]
MTFVTRIGTLINASFCGLANTMSARTGLRSFLSFAVFFVIFVVAYAEFDFVDGKPDGRLAWEFFKLKDDDLRAQEQNQHSFADTKANYKSPQQRYLEEAKQVSSQFKGFKSTFPRLKAPEKYKNPKLYDDPRSSIQTSDIAKSSKIYRPYPKYNTDEWKRTHRGAFVPCVGPRGSKLDESLDDSVSVYVGAPEGFPEPSFGSYEAFGIDGHLSYDRYGRYGAYGFGEDDPSTNWIRPAKVDWENVDWGQLQEECVHINAGRFNLTETNEGSGLASWLKRKTSPANLLNPDIKPELRTAILIRSYTDKVYSENDKQVIRSMVQELSLQSGGEYEVFLLVHVKDDSIPINEKDVYHQVLQDNIPQEFWNMTILWSMPMVSERYNKLDPAVMNVHQSQWLPIQHFVLEYPEFDFVWNWEIDTRYTGHHYEFTEAVASFGRKQPRRGIWERSERFYIPSIHGNYDTDFRQYVAKQAGAGIWGHLAYEDEEDKLPKPKGPVPPVPRPEMDNYVWGVGEEADWVGFLPVFNPYNTDWVLRDDVFGYLGKDTPRRSTIITHSRVSRRVILAMDAENLNGRHIGSEMAPQTIALLHGYKTTYVPHPIWSDKPLAAHRMDRWFNSGVNGRSGSTRDSPFSWGREQRFKDLSWYYRCNIPGRLYWNLLGWEKDGTGGPDYEKQNGRVVLPSMFFHPIKDVTPESDSTHYDLPT